MMECVCVWVHAQWLSHVWLFATPMDCSPPSSSVQGISQARILEWVASLHPGDLPYPGIEPASLTSRVLAGGFFTTSTTWEFPGDSVHKESSYHSGDLGSIPGSGRSLGRWNGNLFQYSCLENSMDRETWWATVHGVAKSWTWLSD